MKHHHEEFIVKHTLTRQLFLRSLAAGMISIVAGPLVDACSTVVPPAAPTIPAPTATKAQAAPTPLPATQPAAAALQPSAASQPSPTKAAPAFTRPTQETPTPEKTAVPSVAQPTTRAFRFDPSVKSRVVHTHLEGVWQGGQLAPQALAKMLDHGITRLTGLNDANEAWLALFKPQERIAIKVNTIDGSSYWTHAVLVKALTDRLAAAGIPAENLLVYDRMDDELMHAHFTINRDGPGVRCSGTNGRYSQKETVAGVKAGVSDLLSGVDALINLPLAKSHGMAGFSFAMKNHYGTINNPGSYHNGDKLVNGLAELNALPVIREKTRLVIGDILEACTSNWNTAKRGDSLMMSFDPVAHDTAGLAYFASLQQAGGINPNFTNQRASQYLAKAAELGYGANNPDKIDLIEEKI